MRELEDVGVTGGCRREEEGEGRGNLRFVAIWGRSECIEVGSNGLREEKGRKKDFGRVEGGKEGVDSIEVVAGGRRGLQGRVGGSGTSSLILAGFSSFSSAGASLFLLPSLLAPTFISLDLTRNSSMTGTFKLAPRGTWAVGAALVPSMVLSRGAERASMSIVEKYDHKSNSQRGRGFTLVVDGLVVVVLIIKDQLSLGFFWRSSHKFELAGLLPKLSHLLPLQLFPLRVGLSSRSGDVDEFRSRLDGTGKDEGCGRVSGWFDWMISFLFLFLLLLGCRCRCRCRTSQWLVLV